MHLHRVPGMKKNCSGFLRCKKIVVWKKQKARGGHHKLKIYHHKNLNEKEFVRIPDAFASGIEFVVYVYTHTQRIRSPMQMHQEFLRILFRSNSCDGKFLTCDAHPVLFAFFKQLFFCIVKTLNNFFSSRAPDANASQIYKFFRAFFNFKIVIPTQDFYQFSNNFSHLKVPDAFASQNFDIFYHHLFIQFCAHVGRLFHFARTGRLFHFAPPILRVVLLRFVSFIFRRPHRSYFFFWNSNQF